MHIDPKADRTVSISWPGKTVSFLIELDLKMTCGNLVKIVSDIAPAFLDKLPSDVVEMRARLQNPDVADDKQGMALIMHERIGDLVTTASSDHISLMCSSLGSIWFSSDHLEYEEKVRKFTPSAERMQAICDQIEDLRSAINNAIKK